MLTRAEKEKRVIELYEQGATYRLIAKEVRISPGHISTLIRRHTGEPEPKKVEVQRQQEREMELEQTVDTKVFKLFKDGKTPVEAAISLNLPAAEVIRLRAEYRKLMGVHELDQLYEEAKDDIFELHKMYKFIKQGGYNLLQIIDAASRLKDLSSMENSRKRLKNEIENLKVQRDLQLRELIEIRNNTIMASED